MATQKVTLALSWHWWCIGVFWDVQARSLVLCPFPMVMLRFDFPEVHGIWADQKPYDVVEEFEMPKPNEEKR